VQGCGKVAYYLSRHLHEDGAKIIATDIDPERVQKFREEFGAHGVAPDEIYDVAADVYAPCALGATLNDNTIPRLRAEVIAGGANNQLADEDRHGQMVEERGLLYAPDFVINGGGLINVYGELEGWARERSLRKAQEIYDTILRVFDLAEREGIPSFRAAERLAEAQLQSRGGAG